MKTEECSSLRKFWLLHSLSILLAIFTVISGGFWGFTELATRANELGAILFGSTLAALLMTIIRKWTWEKNSNDDPPPEVLKELPDECEKDPE